MPQKTLKYSPSRRTRTHSSKRKTKKGTRCTISRGKDSIAPAIFASSLHCVRFEEKPGLAVDSFRNDRPILSGERIDFRKMYRDLRAAYIKAATLIGKEHSKMDPLKDGMDIGMSIHLITKFFRQLLPCDWNIRILSPDESPIQKHYSFLVWKEVPSGGYLHSFEIKPVVMYLKRNRALHNLFLDFMTLFHSQAGIGTWWDSRIIAYLDWVINDHIQMLMDEGEEDAADDFKRLVDEYQNGEIRNYQRWLSQKPKSLSSLKRRLKKFSRRNVVVKWLHSLAQFLSHEGNVNWFIPPQSMESEGLSFDQQQLISWDDNDSFSRLLYEYIDAEVSGCGVHEPMNFEIIHPDMKKLDFDQTDKQGAWPMLLTELSQEYYQMLESLPKPKISKKK